MGYLHNDLKPDNIMVNQRKNGGYELMLIDFGLCSKYIDSEGKHIENENYVTPIGTMNYWPPECHEHKSLFRKTDFV